MLREGIEISGADIQLDGLTDPACTHIEGIPHSGVLLRFANTFMGSDPSGLAVARDALAEAMGGECLVDAVGVASTFQRMDRIADGTGIPSDGPIALMQADLASLLGTDKFLSAGNTKAIPWHKRLLFKLLVIPKMKKLIREKSGAA